MGFGGRLCFDPRILGSSTAPFIWHIWDRLRYRPNIPWKKDRGKYVASAPWYTLFKDDRINDHHPTLAEKRPRGRQRRNIRDKGAETENMEEL